MKLLFCTSSFKTGIGGIASYAHDFINAFAEKYEIVVVTGDSFEQKDTIYKIYHVKMDDFSINNARRLLDIIQEEKPQIIINSYFLLLSLISPYIFNLSKIISISHFTDGKLAWAAGLNFQYIDYIVSLSTFGKKYLERKFHIFDMKKVKIIYNYMNKLPDRNLELKKNRKILKIVYPGGCSYQKSAEIVCKTLKDLLKTNYEFEFYWLGITTIPGSKWPLVRTKTVQDCINVKDSRIKQMGGVPREKAKQIIADANIFLLPSRGEGCPITLLEAMRGGCIPIISDSKHGSLDLVTNGINGIVVHQNSVKELTMNICDILSNHQSYYNIYEKSLAMFDAKLEYGIWKKKMEELLDLEFDHTSRIKFSNLKYKRDRLYLRSLCFFYWLKDRFIHQIYHFLYFRYVRYWG